MKHRSWDQGRIKRGLALLLALALVLVCGMEFLQYHNAEEAKVKAEELALAQVAMDGETIRTGVDKCLEPLMNPTLEGLQNLVAHADAYSLQSLPQNYGITAAELLMHVLRGFSYEVEEVKVDEQAASVRLRVTVLDAKQPVNTALGMVGEPDTAQTISEMYKAEGDEAHAEFLRYLVSILYACLDASDAYVTTELELSLTEQNNEWVLSPQSLNELLTAVTAGMKFGKQ